MIKDNNVINPISLSTGRRNSNVDQKLYTKGIARANDQKNVDFFGPRVGLVKFKTEVVDEETEAKLLGIVFARGGAIGILMLLECEGEKYAVLTEQARVPVGRTLVELPVVMLDFDIGDFVGTAAREGGNDEDITLFLYQNYVDKEVIKSPQGVETGLRDHGELMKLSERDDRLLAKTMQNLGDANTEVDGDRDSEEEDMGMGEVDIEGGSRIQEQ